MTGKNECEMCMNRANLPVKEFITNQPSKGTKEKHKICENCIRQLVEDHFSLTKTGQW